MQQPVKHKLIKTNNCIIDGCKRKKGNGRYCHTCHARKVNQKHPLSRIYRNLKSNAKRRGKHFSLTPTYFKQFVLANGYLQGRGRTAQSLSIDCIKNHLGYREGNIQILTLSANASKGCSSLNTDGGIYTNAEVTF